eukprot:751472-Hanusia_phi.AAC.4
MTKRESRMLAAAGPLLRSVVRYVIRRRVTSGSLSSDRTRPTPAPPAEPGPGGPGGRHCHGQSGAPG